MDSARFDALTRSLSEGMTRRGITRLLGGLTLGLLHPIALAAKNDRDPKKRGDGKKRGTGKGSGKAGKARHEPGKHGHKKGQTDKGKTGRHDSAEPETETAGGDEATRRVMGRRTQDTAETPTASTARDATPIRRRGRDGDDECHQRDVPPGRHGLHPGSAVLLAQVLGEGQVPLQRVEPVLGRPDLPERPVRLSRRDAGLRRGRQLRVTGHERALRPCGTDLCAAARSAPADSASAAARPRTDRRPAPARRAGPAPTIAARRSTAAAALATRSARAGQCVCPVGTTACGDGQCANTQTDPDHCGTCGIACDGGSGTCKSGTCATAEVCDGVDNDFDGAVDEGTLCPANQVCRSGRCGCPEGTRDCDGDDRASHWAPTSTAPAATRVLGGKVCQGGECVTGRARLRQRTVRGGRVVHQLPAGLRQLRSRALGLTT